MKKISSLPSLPPPSFRLPTTDGRSQCNGISLKSSSVQCAPTPERTFFFPPLDLVGSESISGRDPFFAHFHSQAPFPFFCPAPWSGVTLDNDLSRVGVRRAWLGRKVLDGNRKFGDGGSINSARRQNICIAGRRWRRRRWLW